MNIEEYWMDVSKIPPDMETWLLEQGATSYESDRMHQVRPGGRSIREIDVYFGSRKIHYYAGSEQARIFFNKEMKNAGLVIIMKWPDVVIRHNFPHYELGI